MVDSEPAEQLLCRGYSAFTYVGKETANNWVSPVDAIVERDEGRNIVKAKMRPGRRNWFIPAWANVSRTKNNGIRPAGDG